MTPPALDHEFFFNKLFNYSKTKNRSEYSMDAMYLNRMFINPRPRPVATGGGARGGSAPPDKFEPP